MNLTYPAIITKEDDTYYIGFPDLEENIEDCYYSTFGETFEEVIEMGKDYLVVNLTSYEDDKKEFPKSTSIVELKRYLKDNQELVYITLNYEYEKSLCHIAYVKKTLTIPNYLNILAKNKGLNFSQILQKALKKELELI